MPCDLCLLAKSVQLDVHLISVDCVGCAPSSLLQASDRLLLITEALTSTGPASFLASGMGSSDPSEAAGGSSSDLHVHHVLLPAAYLAANWPLQHVAVSPCGGDIAAAGMRGLVVYNRKQERWRMFGEVQQVSSNGVQPAVGRSAGLLFVACGWQAASLQMQIWCRTSFPCSVILMQPSYAY